MIELDELEAADYGKLCYRCETWCFWEEFDSDNTKSDGKRPTCKKCRSITEKQYRDGSEVPHSVKARATRFGLTTEQLMELHEIQEFRCAWCGRSKEETNWLCIDHDRGCCPGDRSCGSCVRRLLCERCNLAEGLLKHWPVGLLSLEAVAWRPLG